MKKILKWGGIIIVVLIIIGAVSSGGDSSSTQNSANDESAAEATEQAEATTYQVNEPITTDKIEVTVTDVEERSQVGSQYLNEKASEGATLVVVNWKYKNISDKPIGSFSQPSIKLVDANGTEYEADLGKTSTYATEQELDNKVLSDLNPGITVKDAEVFEVSKESFAEGDWQLKVKVSGKKYQVEI